MISAASAGPSSDPKIVDLPEISPHEAKIYRKTAKEDKHDKIKKTRSDKTAIRNDGLAVLKLEIELLEKNTPPCQQQKKTHIEIIDEGKLFF